jgi:hypothetical protein
LPAAPLISACSPRQQGLPPHAHVEGRRPADCLRVL